MRLNRTILLLMIAAVVSVFLLGCEDDIVKTSKTERVQQFASDLNNDRSSAYQNIHPDAASRDLYKDPDEWDAAGFDEGPYSFPISTQDGNDLTGNVDAPNDVGFDGEPFRFTMKEDGEDNWKILRLEIPDGGSVFIQQQSDPGVIW